MRELIEAKISELKQKPFSDLALLPAFEGACVQRGGRRLTLSVWKDDIDSRTLRVVVQAYRPWLLGMGQMGALGFEVALGGSLRDLSTEELYEFR